MTKKREPLSVRNEHLTRPPRLEGKAKNFGLNPVRKKKNALLKHKNKNILKKYGLYVRKSE